jgi:hypothetical protein
VLYYTKDGKPDKKRRPGRNWDKSVYAGAERATYSSVGVDLLAFLKSHNPHDEEAKKKGHVSTLDVMKSVKNTVNQTSLQTYLDQVRVYEQLLNPISAILQKHMGLLPQAGVLPPEEAGWGEIGKELTPALQKLGVEPPVELNGLKLKRNIISKEEKEKRKREKLRKEGFLDIPPITLDPGSVKNNLNAYHPDFEGSSSISSPRITTAGTTAAGESFPLPLFQGEQEQEEIEEITAESLRKSLQRYWKKPYQPNFPTEESFGDTDYGKYDYNYFYGHPDEEEEAKRLKKNRKKHGKKNNKAKKTVDFSKSLTVLPAIQEKTSSIAISPMKSTTLTSSSMKMIIAPPSTLSYPSPAPYQGLKSSSTTTTGAEQPVTTKRASRLTTKFSELISTASSLGDNSNNNDSNLFPPSEEEIQQLENLQTRKELHEKRRERKKELHDALNPNRVKKGVIPWELLDEAEAARTKFENEKNYVEFYHKF